LFAAFFNFIAIFVFQLSVAATVGKGIVQPGVVDTHVVFGALVGAITWNVITWYYGIPSSSSHALIGGIVGAVIAKAGAGALDLRRHPEDGSVHLCVATCWASLLGSMMMVAVAWIFRRARPSRVDKWFRRLQLIERRCLQPGPWRQRRAEDDRHHLDDADCDWVRFRQRRCIATHLDHRVLLHRDWSRHHVRWLAHCAALWVRRSPS